MPELLKQESPLAQLGMITQGSQEGTDLWLSELAPAAHINLRGDTEDPGFIDCVRVSTNIRLPATPNSLVSEDGISALWLGPHEWLILAPGGLEAAVLDSLRTALAGHNYAVTDITSGNFGLSLTGLRAKDILAKGCSTDLHQRAIRPGFCIQTNVAKANVLIWRPDDTQQFNLVVRRSFAEYLTVWLLDAGREYGLRFRA